MSQKKDNVMVTGSEAASNPITPPGFTLAVVFPGFTRNEDLERKFHLGKGQVFAEKIG